MENPLQTIGEFGPIGSLEFMLPYSDDTPTLPLEISGNETVPQLIHGDRLPKITRTRGPWIFPLPVSRRRDRRDRGTSRSLRALPRCSPGSNAPPIRLAGSPSPVRLRRRGIRRFDRKGKVPRGFLQSRRRGQGDLSDTGRAPSTDEGRAARQDVCQEWTGSGR
jgi:hypothetical protein